MSVWIWGVGTSKFGRQTDKLAAELAWQALQEALEDADVTRVDAAFVGSVFGTLGVAQRALLGVGLTGIPIVTVENACASGSTAVHEAHQAIAGGRYDTAIALGVEHLTSLFEGPIAPDPTDREQAKGLLFPGIYAMTASRYMHEHGATAGDPAEVAVKNSRHGSRNPRAQRQRALTTDEVLASRMIADPLTLYQCARLSDAAAAIVLGSRRRSSRDVSLRASVLRSGRAWDQDSEHVWGYEVVRDTANDAYSAAGIDPSDADVIELHHAFTIGEIVKIEALGLADEGTPPSSSGSSVARPVNVRSTAPGSGCWKPWAAGPPASTGTHALSRSSRQREQGDEGHARISCTLGRQADESARRRGSPPRCHDDQPSRP